VSSRPIRSTFTIDCIAKAKSPQRIITARRHAIALIGVLSIFLTSGRAAFIIVTVLLAATLGIRELDYEEFNVVRSGLVLRMYDYRHYAQGVLCSPTSRWWRSRCTAPLS
jgi:hypothetical protein